MRDIYVWFSLIYFLAGGFHLYQQYQQNKMLANINKNLEIMVNGTKGNSN